MKEGQDYLRDIVEIRTMMERTSRFLSLAGWAGIMAGVYALAGAYIAYAFLDFNPSEFSYHRNALVEPLGQNLLKLIILASIILVLTLCTAIFLSSRKSKKRGESLWNSTTRRLVINMGVPLFSGGILILILISKGFIGLVAPLTLIFYGLALYNASKFTFEEMRILGLIQIGLGLIGSYFVEYGLLFWAIGFGIFHIVYGIYLHYKYER